MHATDQHVASTNPPDTANLGIADPSAWVAHLNVSNICHVASVHAIMPLPNPDLVSHIPDNFWDSFSSSIPEDDDDVLSDLAAEEDTTRPSDSSFVSVDPDKVAPLPEWAAHTKVADAMDIDPFAAPSDPTKPPASEKNDALYDDVLKETRAQTRSPSTHDQFRPKDREDQDSLCFIART